MDDINFCTKEKNKIFKQNNKLINRIINTLDENKKLELEISIPIPK